MCEGVCALKLQNYCLLNTSSVVVTQIFALNEIVFIKPCSSLHEMVSYAYHNLVRHILDMILKV